MDLPGLRDRVESDRWAVLVSYEHAVRCANTESAVLQLAADAVAGCGLYRCAVISLHDSQGNLGAIGYTGVPSDLIEAARRAPRVRKEVREAVLQEKHRLSQSYFIPVEAGIDLSDEARHIPNLHQPDPLAEWQAGDELFTPLRHSNGDILGFSSVDEPFDQRRPNPESVRLLELIMERAAGRVEHLRQVSRLTTLEARVERLVTQCNDVAYEFDVRSGAFTSISPAIRLLAGVEPSEVIGRGTGDWIRRFVHPDDREKVSRHYLGLGSSVLGGTTNPAICEYRMLRESGGTRWVRDKTWAAVDEDGQVVGFEGLIRDITSIQSLSGELAKWEERYRLISDNARDLIYARDGDGNITYISPSVADYLGVSPEEFLQSHFSAWLTDDPRNRVAFEAFDNAPSGFALNSPFSLELRARDGRGVLFEFVESPVFDEYGQVIGAQGVGRDITEREELLRTLHAQSERADAANAALKSLVSRSRRNHQRVVDQNNRLKEKVNQLESFVHIVSHDLRAPLVTLQGLTGLLKRRYARQLDESGSGTVKQIGAESQRLMRLITDLLDYARAGSDEGSRRPVDLGLVIESVWTRMIEGGIRQQVTLRLPETAILVWADPVAIERVIENLLNNAVTHSDPELPLLIEVEWAPAGREISVLIRDNGPGIDPEVQDRIFELFYRGQGVESAGSGLGLAIVKRIMEASSGSVVFEPNPAGGSVFRLRWPAHPASIAPQQ